MPIYGNHELFTCDQMDMQNPKENDNLLAITSEIWKEYLDEQAFSDLKNLGYYTLYKAEWEVRFIVMNTQACDNYNSFLYANLNDPGGELEWIKNTLLQAESLQ